MRKTYTPSEAALDFAVKITATWQKAVASIIQTGQLLIQAKRDLTHGQFASLFDDPPSGDCGRVERRVPFSQRTAERLMRIAGNKVLTNATHASNLPASWATLYLLTCIPEDQLEVLIKAGGVNADITRKDAECIVGFKMLRPVYHAMETLIATMHRYPIPIVKGIVNDFRHIPNEGHWGLFSDLDRLSRWIAEFHKEWAQADAQKDKQATRAYIEDKAEDDEDDDD